jgi:hypothetical protein
MCTSRLNDGVFRVHRFSSVTPARLHKSDFVLRFYIYGGIFDNPPGYFLFVRGTGCFRFVCFFFCLDVNSGPSSPEGAQLTMRGGGFLLSRVLFLVTLLVVVCVFVVYISLRDDGC